MGRNKIRELPPKFLLFILGIVLLIALLLVWVGHHYIRPFPPRSLVMATGMEGGAFAFYGERYKEILARDKIRVEVRFTSGAVENLRLLKDKTKKVDAGFVQSGITKAEQTSNLVSLGSLTYTPLWIFYRGNKTLDDPSELKGKSIAIGPEGSGVQKFAHDLLKAANASGPTTVLHEISYTSALKALKEGKVDAVMAFGAASNQVVLKLLHEKDVRLMNFSQVEAYTRLFPDFSHVIFPKGILDPSKRFPPSDVHLLSPRVDLIVSEDLHPALAYLLLKASVEIHGGAGWVHRAGEFPSMQKQDFPISEQAQRFYRSGGSRIYEYLPFWVATFVDRMILLLIPLGVIIIPLIGILPWVFTWRNRSKYYGWYRELRSIEKEMKKTTEMEGVRHLLERLDEIEESVNSIHISIVFYDELFILKEHIQMVRRRLFDLNRTISKDFDGKEREERS